MIPIFATFPVLKRFKKEISIFPASLRVPISFLKLSLVGRKILVPAGALISPILATFSVV